jgi:D-alanyl-D-alanine carboxypeptidase/D-alanyl-D-alanine-endopeptidase (penicillin-binding protein 4)
MRKSLSLLAALAVAAASALAVSSPVAQARPASAKTSARTTLASQVAKALRGSSATHMDYAFHVQDVGTVSHGAQTPSAPASNQKLFTTITALQDLGRDYRYNTVVSGTTRLTSHTLHGDLVLRGSGDPTLLSSNLLSIAKRLHTKGLRHVSGHLIVDDTRYSHQTRVPGWKHSFVPVETGTVDAFSVNYDTWHSGASFDADPTRDNAKLWREELKKAHITVAGSTRIEAAPDTVHPLVTHRSADLAAIIDDLLTNSVNYFAEMLLREIGAATSGHGTAASGIAAERTLAAKWKLPLGATYDGSGLSYSDRETPATITAWLSKLTSEPYYTTEFYALPLSCATGTLETRLCGPHVRDQVRAKTGTIDHVSALSGYFETMNHHFVTFSVLTSGFSDADYQRIYNHVDAAIGVIRRKG